MTQLLLVGVPGFGRSSGVTHSLQQAAAWGQRWGLGEWFIFIDSCWVDSRRVGGREPSSKKMASLDSITNPIAASILSPLFAVADNGPCLKRSTNSPLVSSAGLSTLENRSPSRFRRAISLAGVPPKRRKSRMDPKCAIDVIRTTGKCCHTFARAPLLWPLLSPLREPAPAPPPPPLSPSVPPTVMSIPMQ